VENTDYAAFAGRVIWAHARRIADGDVDALADLLRLAGEVDTATQTAVTGLRSFGYSWAEIATRLGTIRQAAQQRWGTRDPGAGPMAEHRPCLCQVVRCPDTCPGPARQFSRSPLEGHPGR
jgi:hypothetical protein